MTEEIVIFNRKDIPAKQKNNAFDTAINTAASRALKAGAGNNATKVKSLVH